VVKSVPGKSAAYKVLREWAMRLKDQVAIVTGGSRGIGRAIVKALAAEGARVACIYRGNQQAAETLAQEVQTAGGNCQAFQCDVGQLDEAQKVGTAVEAKWGQVDILVNNAGTNIAQGPALEMTDAQFDKMIEINLKSAYRLTRLVAPGMCERGWGSIVNIASIAGLRPQFESLLYSLTKAALIMMTQSYALELGPRGVRVNAIAPGLVETTLSEYYWKDESRFRPLMQRQPIKHLGQPVEIAEIALMLASDDASYLTGQTLIVDGGRLLSSM
jgi:NAD(P)-dependent dehydrogenase (short-subunit alcohol dehydrogenase family)